MITIEEAQKLISESLLELGSEKIRVSDSLGKVLSDTVYSPADHPFFDQTAVDGYAVKFSEDLAGKPLNVIGEIQAGGSPVEINDEQAVRIFTGGTVPESCDTVVMQEYCNREGNLVTISAHTIRKGQNIRRKGEQIAAGAIALEKGTVLNATHIGFLISIGIFEVEVFIKPKISILATGGEFMKEGESADGKIYQSNGIMLQKALLGIGIEAEAQECEDDLELLTNTVHELSESSDILIITGGVSVGSYDFTPEAITRNGFEIVFHKVKQKPGKPMLFAAKPGKVIFGLPGNPRAVMIAFYIYILRYLEMCQSVPTPGLLKFSMPLMENYNFKGDRDVLLAARVVGESVSISHGQQSHMLQSLASSDVIVHLPVGNTIVKEGDLVDVYFL